MNLFFIKKNLQNFLNNKKNKIIYEWYTYIIIAINYKEKLMKRL